MMKNHTITHIFSKDNIGHRQRYSKPLANTPVVSPDNKKPRQAGFKVVSDCYDLSKKFNLINCDGTLARVKSYKDRDMTFEQNQLDEAVTKIIITSLFDTLNEKQKEKFYKTAFRLIDGQAYCNTENQSERTRALLSEALREQLTERLAELS